jgi:hypothetical protein
MCIFWISSVWNVSIPPLLQIPLVQILFWTFCSNIIKHRTFFVKEKLCTGIHTAKSFLSSCTQTTALQFFNEPVNYSSISKAKITTTESCRNPITAWSMQSKHTTEFWTAIWIGDQSTSTIASLIFIDYYRSTWEFYYIRFQGLFANVCYCTLHTSDSELLGFWTFSIVWYSRN